MNISGLMSAIEEVLSAQSEQELASILVKNPVLLEQETLLKVMEKQARQQGEQEVGRALQKLIVKIATFQSQSSQHTPSIEPKVMWAIKARRYLALQKKELLGEAIAEAQGQTEIVNFLQAVADENIFKIDRLAKQLIPKLQFISLEEALTLKMYYLDTRVVLTETYIDYPFEQQKQARELGTQACQYAIQTAQMLNDKPCQAIYSGMLATCFVKSRQLGEAEPFFTQALQLYRELAEQEPHIFNQYVAVTLNNFGIVQFEMRKFAEAEKSYAEALQLLRELAEQEPHIFNPKIAGTLNGLGNLQKEMQKLTEAEKSYAEALQIRRELAKHEPHIFNLKVAGTLKGLGNVQREMRKFAEAEKSYAEALQLFRELADRESNIFNQDVAESLHGLGVVQLDMRKLTEAENSFTEALQLFRSLHEQEPHIFNPDVAGMLQDLGNVQTYLRKLTEAEKSYAGALQLYRELAEQEPHIFSEHVAGTLNNLGNLKVKQDKLDEAKENFESARDLLEDLRAKAITIDDRNRILQAMSPIYHGLLACYIKMEDWKKALVIAELGKSRSLSDLLNLKSEDLRPKAPTPDALEIVKDLSRKYSDAIKELQKIESYERYLSEQLYRFENTIKRIKDAIKNDGDVQQASLRQITEQKQPLEEEKQKAQSQRFAKQDELKRVLEEIKKYDQDFPPKAKDINPESIFEISKNLNRTIVMFRILRESTALIFVFPTGELHIKEIKGFGHTETYDLFGYKWAIPYQQWKESHKMPDLKEASWQALPSPETETEDWIALMEKTLETLYEKLMFYVHQILREKSSTKEVLFIPSQSLALLPLHAASWKDEKNKKHYLLEEFTISYCPSVSVFKRCQENEKGRTDRTLLINNPTRDLDFSEKEVDFIKKNHRMSTDLRGRKATKSAVLKALQDDYGFTHFACHGFYNSENQFDSGLIMSNGVITLGEIINCNLQNNWLTTLSACETGIVDFASPTDEHFGLPLGFIFAGSPSVWASLWLVSDETTSLLMQKAYENLSREEFRNNKPESLRQAQLSILREFSHPYYWAGFQHYGI